jgi:hypothetical protein
MKFCVARVLVAIAVLGGVVQSARAQTPAARPLPRIFANVSFGGQTDTRSLESSATFTSFNEPGAIASTQTIGRPFLFDATGGYRFNKILAVGAGVWTAYSKSAFAARASLPDPLFVGRPSSVEVSAADLKQLVVGINLQGLAQVPVTNRVFLTVFGGPTFARVSLDVGSGIVDAGGRTVSVTTERQKASATNGGNAGLDLSYHFNDLNGLGVFVRYVSGEVDLPALQHVKIGGLQVGGGIRARF